MGLFRRHPERRWKKGIQQDVTKAVSLVEKAERIKDDQERKNLLAASLEHAHSAEKACKELVEAIKRKK